MKNGGKDVVTSPVPHMKHSKINEMHEKGDRGGGKDFPSLKIIWLFLYYPISQSSAPVTLFVNFVGELATKSTTSGANRRFANL